MDTTTYQSRFEYFQEKLDSATSEAQIALYLRLLEQTQEFEQRERHEAYRLEQFKLIETSSLGPLRAAAAAGLIDYKFANDCEERDRKAAVVEAKAAKLDVLAEPKGPTEKELAAEEKEAVANCVITPASRLRPGQIVFSEVGYYLERVIKLEETLHADIIKTRQMYLRDVNSLENAVKRIPTNHLRTSGARWRSTIRDFQCPTFQRHYKEFLRRFYPQMYEEVLVAEQERRDSFKKSE